MNGSKMDYLLDSLREFGFLEKIGWSSLRTLTTVDPKISYEEAEGQIMKDPLASFILPLTDVPLERNEDIQLAGLSARLDCQFYLRNKTEIRNIAFLGESHTIHYNNPLVKVYLNGINPEVQTRQVPIAYLANYELAIDSGKLWSQEDLHLLHPQEWTPLPGDGLYVVVCHPDNVSLRKQVAKFHNKENQVFANIERRIQQVSMNQSEIILLGAHCFRDSQNNYQVYVVVDNGHDLQYLVASQSTSHGLTEALLTQLK